MAPDCSDTSDDEEESTTSISSGQRSGLGGLDSSLGSAVAPGDDEVPRILALLASVLERLIARNEQYMRGSSNRGSSSGKYLGIATARGAKNVFSARSCSSPGMVFSGLKAPSISIEKYLERIFKYTNCSPACFVVGYVYIDRLSHKHPDLPITPLNVHRLLVTSVMTASKILDDVHFNNAFFARVGGISTSEVNKLELEFLFRLDFRLTVTVQEFESYCSYLDREARLPSARPDHHHRSGFPAFESPRSNPKPPLVFSLFQWKP
ncbi:hypothetical protein SELMODRAFT_416667 [Selaginella moellendorffii]|uniref:Cyclin n=2 Tax=Selaginella moellendorffii TaxID=88036 RepID=D8S011_SELML|nr:hypothetical protein SELMODRAFT_416667 [Selaginella moellendorffii]